MFVNSPSGSLSYESETHAISLHPHIALDRVAVIILGGGEGKRLAPLTKTRCKPAISFGGRYSLIDVPISHALSSGLKKIYVIGQYMAYSLQKHLFKTYHHNGIFQNQIELLMPEERSGKKIWFKGTADAIRQNLEYFAEIPADYFLILSGDQLYNINFQKMIQFGIEKNAGMVIAAQPVNEKDAKRMGLLKIEHGGSRIIDFYEKPQEKGILERFYTDEFTLHRLGYEVHNSRHYLGSMGIYCFKRQVLFDLLNQDPREDFGKHLIATQMQKQDVHAFLYDGYWEDIGTIESYYNANLALTRANESRAGGLQCYNEGEVIFTKAYNLPGTKVTDCHVQRSLLCEGSIIEASEVAHCVIGVRSVIHKGTRIRDSVIMGNEYYCRAPLKTGESSHCPCVGENCEIQKAIIDENVTIGCNVKLLNRAGQINFDSPDGKIVVRDGIIIVPRGTDLPDNYIF